MKDLTKAAHQGGLSIPEIANEQAHRVAFG
jgi:hypothetical protein